VAMTPEGKVKKQVVKQLKELGGVYYFFPATGGYGKSGVPDIVGCYRGKFFAIECKAGKNTTTPLQERELDLIQQSGGAAWVVNEENMDRVCAWLAKQS
jgi:Holliday junction resolvase